MDDVFDGDDAVVDDLANCNGQSSKRHRVDANTERMYRQNAADERHRHGQEGDEGRAPVHQEQEQHRDHDQRALQQRDTQVMHRSLDEVRLSKHVRVHADAIWQCFSDLSQRRLDLAGRGQGVCSIGLGDRSDHRVRACECGVAALDLGTMGDIGDIADRDRHTVAQSDDGGLDVVERGDPANAADDEFLSRTLHECAWNIGVGGLQGLADVLDADPVGLHTQRIHAYLILLDLAANRYDRSDAAERQQPRPHVPVGERAQLFRRQRVADQCVLHQPANGRCHGQHHRRLRSLRQLCEHVLQALVDELPVEVDIRIRREHHDDRGQTYNCFGTHRSHARRSVDRTLQRIGDQRFDILRCHSRCLGLDHDLGWRELREHIHRHPLQDVTTSDEQHDRQCQHDQPVVQCPCDEVIEHGQSSSPLRGAPPVSQTV